MGLNAKPCSIVRMTLVVFFVTLILVPGLALSEETCKFERMWPTLQQPWFFN